MTLKAFETLRKKPQYILTVRCEAYEGEYDTDVYAYQSNVSHPICSYKVQFDFLDEYRANEKFQAAVRGAVTRGLRESTGTCWKATMAFPTSRTDWVQEYEYDGRKAFVKYNTRLATAK